VGLRNFTAYFSRDIGRLAREQRMVAALSNADRRATRVCLCYGLTRTCMPAKGLFYAAALVPVFAPSLLSAISLIYIFGNQDF